MPDRIDLVNHMVRSNRRIRTDPGYVTTTTHVHGGDQRIVTDYNSGAGMAVGATSALVGARVVGSQLAGGN